MDIRRGVAMVGRTMIRSGVLILLFVIYQLWGTGITEARYQRQLTKEFEESLLDLAATSTTTTSTSTTAVPVPGSTAPTTTTTVAQATQAPPPAPAGDAVAIIKIPRLNLEKAVVQGVTLNLLKRGPGHYPSTPMPGQPGNAAIAGHRTTYGAPFGRLDDLKAGDPILVTTRQGRFRYEVTRKVIVQPEETSVLQQRDENLLTLTTCHPRFSASRRLVVVAVLTGEAAGVPAPPPTTTTTTLPPTTVPGVTTVATTAPTTTTTTQPSLLDAEEEGLSGRGASNGPAIAWGAAAAAVWFLVWLAAKRWRRWKWPLYLLGTPVF
ncbi:MAG: class E sortase, partial [Acidimicrobiales bacterium]